MRETRTSGSVGAPGSNARGHPAAQAKVGDCGLASLGDGLDVVILQRAPRGAAGACVVQVSTLAVVARSHRPLHLSRDRARRLRRTTRTTRSVGLRESTLLEMTHQDLEGARQHIGDLPAAFAVLE